MGSAESIDPMTTSSCLIKVRITFIRTFLQSIIFFISLFAECSELSVCSDNLEESSRESTPKLCDEGWEIIEAQDGGESKVESSNEAFNKTEIVSGDTDCKKSNTVGNESETETDLRSTQETFQDIISNQSSSLPDEEEFPSEVNVSSKEIKTEVTDSIK